MTQADIRHMTNMRLLRPRHKPLRVLLANNCWTCERFSAKYLQKIVLKMLFSCHVFLMRGRRGFLLEVQYHSVLYALWALINRI